MKKLIGMFLWFCTATFLAQIAILGLAAWKGNVRRDTASQVIALLNGIDIQGERLKQVLISGRTAPTLTPQEIQDAKISAALELDSKSRALESYQRRLDDSQRKLQDDIKRFDQRREEFNLELKNSRNGVESENLNETQKILAVLSPDAAKKQLVTMMEKDQKADVVAIIRGMPADIQKKILAEFTTDEDQAMLADVLREIRNGEPLKSLIDNALENQPK
jgi:hypothetical protein